MNTVTTPFRVGSLVKPIWTNQFGIIVTIYETFFGTEYEIKWFNNYGAGPAFYRDGELELLSQ